MQQAQITPPWTALDWSKIQKFLQLLATLMEAFKTPEERLLASSDPKLAAMFDWFKLLKALDWISKNGPDLMAKMNEFISIFSEAVPMPEPLPEPTPPVPPIPAPGPAPQP